MFCSSYWLNCLFYYPLCLVLLPCPHIADWWGRHHSPPATTRWEILNPQASWLLAQSVVLQTHQTYSPGVRSYIQFAQQLRFRHLAPTVNDIVLFMTSLSASLSGKTISVYLPAVRHHFVLNDGPVDLLRAPRILALLKGIDRDKLTSRPMPVPPSSRRAVTPNDLKAIRGFLEFSHYAPQDKAMLLAAVFTAFHGLMRVSEYTAPSPTTVDTHRTLQRSHVALSEEKVMITLGVTKTAQSGAGGTVLLYASSYPTTCPVCSVAAYISAREWVDTGAPFFAFREGRHLPPRVVNDILKRALGPGVSNHSLGISGARPWPNDRPQSGKFKRQGAGQALRTRRTFVSRQARQLISRQS